MRFFLALLALLLCAGCARRSDVRVHQEKIVQLEQQLQAEQRKIAQLEAQVDAQAVALLQEITALKSQIGGMKSQVDEVTSTFAARSAELTQTQARFQDVIDRAAADQKKRDEVLRQMREASQSAP
jgi:chromosome segregation ATPase